MKKIYLLACGALMCVGLTAQKASTTHTEKPVDKEIPQLSKVDTDYYLEMREKGNLIDIWTDDFSDPSTWTFGNNSDPAEDWVIGPDGPEGFFSNALGVMTSTSGGNFAKFDSDFKGEVNGSGYSGVQDSWVTNANPIDLSAFPNVVLSFESYYRKFNDAVFVEVSNNFLDWTAFEIQANLGTNNTSENPTLEVINVSSVIGGESTAYVRFRFIGSWDYAWMVDDVIISEQLPNDLKMNFSFVSHHPASGLEYGIVPPEQLSDITVGGEFNNFGTDEQTNSSIALVMTDDGGTEVLNTATAGVNVASGDTLFVDHTESGITWASGNYTTSFELSSDQEQSGSDNFDDNVDSRVFQVNNGAYGLDGIDVYPNLSLGAIGTESFTDATDDLMLFTEYRMDASQTIYGVEVVLGAGSDVGGVLFAALLDTADVLAEPPNVDDSFWLAESDEYTLTQEDLDAGFVLIEFDNPITVDPGGYYAAVELFSSGNVADVAVLDDQTIPQPGLASAIFIVADNTVFSNGNALALRLMTDEDGTVGVTEIENPVALMSQNVPNPASDFTRIDYELTNMEDVTIRVTDITGKIVFEDRLGEQATGVYQYTLDVRQLSSGIHHYSIVTAHGAATQKMTVVK